MNQLNKAITNYIFLDWKNNDFWKNNNLPARITQTA